ncbi:MAG: HNH endonuclease signature motif containing protein [Candidatus Polarisedimenticolia bacterium]
MSVAHAIVTHPFPSVAEAGRPYRTDRTLEQAHQVAVSLAAARARVVLPLARVAAAVVSTKTHFEFGYARLEDFCRERHGRGARWVRDLATLQAHFERLPSLAAAVAGDDGGAPLHVSAAMAIGAVATPESVDGWIARGRAMTLDRLKKEIRAAAVDAIEPERVQVRLSVPPAVRAAFDETLDLYRAVVGSETGVTSFVEAMVAEAMTEPEPQEMGDLEGRTDPLLSGLDRSVVEEAREQAAGGWVDLPRAGKASWAMKLAGSSLERLRRLMEVAGTGDVRQLDRHLGELLRLQNSLELRLGEVLREMGKMKGWSRLGFEDAGHYAERILSISRTAAEDRVWVAHAIRPFALVRQSYERGELMWEATRSVLRLLQGTDAADLGAQRAWIAHGRSCTVKRLRDEAKARRRTLAMDGPVQPMSDDVWHASLRREPGTAAQRMAAFGERLVTEAERQTVKCRMDEEPMRLRLPVDLAGDLLKAIRLRRVRESDPATASWRLTRIFSTRGWRLPLWVGLLELLEDCVRLWDPVEANVGGPDRRELFPRSGYRCSAPGCTGRALLQDHHLVFRSAGGGDELTNRESLCLFHHLRGIHRGLAAARGRAPLGITWRLGRDGVGGRFRNERRL